MRASCVLHVRIITTCLSMELRACCLGALQLGPQCIEFGALPLGRPCGAACDMQRDKGRAASPDAKASLARVCVCQAIMDMQLRALG